MSNRKWFQVVLGLCVCVLLGVGCRTRPPDWADDSDDLLDPESVGTEGQYTLGVRVEDGDLIHDAQFETVLFAYDSFQIAGSEIEKIERVADYMRRNPNVRLVAEGHCDERGSREYNMSLGEYRALAVRAHLIGIGIGGTMIQTRSFGEESPLDNGHNEGAWRVNRRVEFKLYR